jgi:raffinose/stachyose/melibiose transport system permease protein
LRWLSRKRHMMLMLLPAVAIYAVFLVLPVLYAAVYSFTNYNGVSTSKFIGAANYRSLVDDHLFWNSLKNSGIIVGVGLMVLLPAAFFVAILLSGKIPGSGFLRASIFGPAIIAPILVGLVWVYILDPHLGLVNRALSAVGIPWQPQWIGGTKWTPIAVGLVFVWQQLGFVMTIFYAGLRSLPNDVIEAVQIDGATAWQRIRYITFPMMREPFGICAALVITGAFKVFELVYVLTSGGPAHLSDVLATYMYSVTFNDFHYGYGMALSIALTVLGIAGAVLSLSLVRRKGD